VALKHSSISAKRIIHCLSDKPKLYSVSGYLCQLIKSL
jgi:hypothetical protein